LAEETKRRRFERVVLPHLDASYNLARWLVRRPDAAEDVVQEAMLRAYRFLDGCREATARAWLLSVVRNVAYDWMRTCGEEKVSGFADIDPEDTNGSGYTTDAFGAVAETPEGLLLKADARRTINDLIVALPPRLREVVVLREFEDLSYKEIAEVAGIPMGTVMSRLGRARDLLQKAWRDRNG
jgi:RNA polymerase sigma-70 factor, ECF subfamily